MPIALDEDLRALADSVGGLAARHAATEDTRGRFADLAAGVRPPVWQVLLDNGLHALHLPEEVGGAGVGLPELAVVAEQSGTALLPGPWLPTVTASAALLRLDPAHELVADFAGGATGALVRGGLTAEPAGDAWRLHGTSAPALGLVGADHALVGARSAAGETRWFVLSGSELADRVEAGDAVDLTRSIGRLRADGLTLLPLATTGDVAVDLVMAALYGAEAAGVSAWALRTAVDYVKTRVQFGQPVGAFQAVQHKAAMMLVRAEVAAASAWDAARAGGDAAEQQQLAAAQAALNAVAPSVDLTLDLVSLLGGIGFTWEHDAHLYQRRALSLAALIGTTDSWAQRLGERAIEVRRDFSFLDPSTLPELRAEVGPVLDRVAALTGADANQTWARITPGPIADLLTEARLVSPHYPAPYGRDAGVQEQAVIADEFEARGLTPPSTVIGEWVLPTLLVHGSAAQQERFIAPSLRGEIIWCQLFSEPGAGSDLASLSTKATKVDGGWLLNGQKVWNSGAHEAHWGVCLARSDASAPKHKGISYFLVDMSSPGVDVRPLKQSTGRAEFNEVFLDDVFVPDDCLVGAREQGWRLAVTTLGNERLSMGGRLTHGSADRFLELLQEERTDVDRAEVLRAFGRSTAREIALSALNLRSILARLSGLEIGAETSVQKVFNTLAQKDGSFDLLRVLGPEGAVLEGGHAIDHIGLPAVLFGGGTTEIQLNVIAQRVLGLPR
ncbi:acyl-CoA dehydrogenase [Nocardioides daejeonensis]|uniref:acyl-CoA dehydrogenase n=1 Tax=Nocardioides daejeonensis TaxID=1046556 RepID=UPI000D74C1A2|nr:acyl-CoA dehydrogenase [Nocardioides daejeonensis]